jgi:hypothetical protein
LLKRGTLKCDEREKRPTRPPTLIKTIIKSMLSLITATRQLSNLTNIWDKIDTMHTETNAAAQETTKEMTSIKEEQNNTNEGLSNEHHYSVT